MARSKNQTLTYVFHNPNSESATIEFLQKFFIEIGKKRLDDYMRENMQNFNSASVDEEIKAS